MLKSNHQDCEFHKSVSAEYAIVCKALRRSWFRLEIFSLSHRGALKEELLVLFREKNSEFETDLESDEFFFEVGLPV